MVSLSPALTRTVADLGLGETIVGRTQFCRSVDPDVPVVGDLYEIDYEVMIQLRPTHVLVQPPGSGLDPELALRAEREGWTIGAWRMNSLADIAKTIDEIPGVLSGGDPEPEGPLAEARSRADRMLAWLRRVMAGGGDGGPDDAALWTGPTLLLADVDPIRAFGRETYLDELLRGLGAANAIELAGWPELTIEDLLVLDPPAIVIVRDRGGADADPYEAAGTLAGLDLRAVREGRLAVLFDRATHLPSSGVVDVARALRGVLERLAAAPGAPAPRGADAREPEAPRRAGSASGAGP